MFSHLTETHPVERRHQFALSVSLPSASCSALRMVPRRSAQQHVHIAVSRSGTLVAVLPYDNKLRLLHMLHGRVDDALDLPLACSFDTWDVKEGKRVPRALGDNSTPYADEAGLDVETALQFAADDERIVLAARTAVSLFKVDQGGTRNRISHVRDFTLATALTLILGYPDMSRGVGSAAVLSPDGKELAWVVFAGSPARVYLTLWDVDSGRVTGIAEVTTIHQRRWSALGWGRVAYAPNSRYLVVVVNGAKKILRTESVGGELCRTKLCRFVTAVFDTGGESSWEKGAVREMTPIRERCDWLELSPDAFAEGMCGAVVGSLEGLCLDAASGHVFGQEGARLSRRRQLNEVALVLNCVHSCPGEATYKALSFGQATRHPWFVTKQPMYSLRFGMEGNRVQVATSPHANAMHMLVRSEEARRSFVVERRREDGKRWRDGPGRRRQVFRSMPWRTSFATVTAFSATGKWVAGASLLDDDQCCVCIRNVTLAEYFG